MLKRQCLCKWEKRTNTKGWNGKLMKYKRKYIVDSLVKCIVGEARRATEWGAFIVWDNEGFQVKQPHSCLILKLEEGWEQESFRYSTTEVEGLFYDVASLTFFSS